ncbi:MAG: DUF1573 domain-containing protein [Chthoniobacterales bacterium]
MKAIYFIPAALVFFLPGLAQADLKWEQTSVDVNPTVTDKQAVGHFKYQNTGDQPVHFKSVKTSCGCTAARSQQDQVAPGEKGEITATLNIGDRVGQQVKTITVETDDPAHAATVLTMKANIPQLLELQPTFVFWQAGEEPKAKTVSARVGKDIPVKDLQVTTQNTQFEAKVEKGSEPGVFRIDIKPKETKTTSFATFTVRPDYPKDAQKAFYISARVAGAPAAAIPPPAAPVAAASASPGK